MVFKVLKHLAIQTSLQRLFNKRCTMWSPKQISAGSVLLKHFGADLLKVCTRKNRCKLDCAWTDVETDLGTGCIQDCVCQTGKRHAQFILHVYLNECNMSFYQNAQRAGRSRCKYINLEREMWFIRSETICRSWFCLLLERLKGRWTGAAVGNDGCG